MGEDAGKGGKKGGRSRTQRKHFRQDRENVWKRPRNNTSSSTNKNDDAGSESSHSAWEPFATQNPDFNEYYKKQMIVSPEEWDTFMEVLRKPLPAAFRINSSGQFCLDLKYQLENDFMKSLQSEVADGGELQAIRPLPWYPDNLAWHSNFSRMQLRKNQTLERFHRFLKLENEIGNITRQEAVSMVPPLFLDVHPDHFVLDMCAAPGSKTFQLLEIIHQSTKPGSLPNGMVMANDLDVQRCNLLIHQTKRMCTANLVVTNNEAQHFPHCRPHKNNSGTVEVEIQSRPWTSQLVFDRVLCDVPCSGDGTLRKAPDIWRKWSVGMGNGIHSLQIQIALRGASLLKVGGRMVYSTCSMNPVENEAVVAEILRKCDGSLQLVDVSSELPQLVCRQGLKKWKVRDKSVWLTSYKDVGEFRKNAIFPSMFPSGGNHMDSNNELVEKQENVENGNTEKLSPITENHATVLGGSDDELCKFPLERCMRIVPHDQNSGAFFIAVFHKVSPLPVIQVKQNTIQRDSCCYDDTSSLDLSSKHIEVADSMNVSKADESDGNVLDASETNLIEDGLDRDSLDYNTSKTPEEHNPEEAQGASNPDEAQGASEKKTDLNKTGGRKKLQLQGKWKGVDPVVFFQDNAVIDSIRAFYGIAESFPFNGHLVTRNSDTNHVKRIYYISKSVKDVLEMNFAVGQQLKVTSVGLKIFERQTTKEGSVMPCLFRISSEGLPLILPYITKQILCASPADFKHLLQYKSIKFSDFLDTEFRQRASDLLQGCCVIVMGKDKACSSDSIQVDESTIAIGCWKGRASLNVMVTTIDCEELLERLSMRSEIEKESCMEVDNNHSNATADETNIGNNLQKNDNN